MRLIGGFLTDLTMIIPLALAQPLGIMAKERFVSLTAETRLFQEGQINRGNYGIEFFLGEGKFSEVYRVKHRFFGRQAMNLLKANRMAVEDIEEILKEAVLLSRSMIKANPTQMNGVQNDSISR